MSNILQKTIVLFGFILSVNAFAQDQGDKAPTNPCAKALSINMYLADLSYNTHADSDPQIINLREFAWKALTRNPDLNEVLNYLIERGWQGGLRFVISDVMVTSAGHVNWEELNKIPTGNDPSHDINLYDWAIETILVKAVQMAVALGYSAATILSTELTKPEMMAIEILKIGGESLTRTGSDVKKISSISGEEFIFKWEKSPEGDWKYVRQDRRP